MPTKYYSPSGEPVDLSRARAVTLRTEFISIEQAFIGVERDTNRALTFPSGETQDITLSPSARAGGILALDNTTGDAVVFGGANDPTRKGQILGWDASSGELKYWDYASTITSPVNAAVASKEAAAASEEAAAASKEAAAASEQKAYKWANTPYGTEVDPGKFSAFHWATQAYKWAETGEDIPVVDGEYSAKHWARKAAQYVADGVIDDATVTDVTTWSSSKVSAALDETLTAVHSAMADALTQVDDAAAESTFLSYMEM